MRVPGDAQTAWQCDLTLILPAYNERSTILSTIDEALAYFESRDIKVEIIVAADGNDGTREVVREKAATTPHLIVIGHEQPVGKGRAIREAVPLATGQIIGFADADNKVPISEYDKVRPYLAQGCALVSGSRALAKSQIERRQPMYRRLGSKGFYWLMQTIVGLPGIEDSQCGFKFFPREVARQLFGLQRIDHVTFDVEILALAHYIGYRIQEVPIRWHDDGDSRLNLVSGSLRVIADMFRIRRYLSGLKEAPVAFAPAAGQGREEAARQANAS
jgi:dolichyl-phosphate beta-glucosyltransferase